MAEALGEFSLDRLEAVRGFVQTMIVVDDEADLSDTLEPLQRAIARPGRAAARAAASDREPEIAPGKADLTHRLDGKALIDSALEHGLVCSIVRPRSDEDLVVRLQGTVQNVDIICVDWKLHGDDGETILPLIRSIVQSDREVTGRLRLIVIYTAERARGRIINRVKRELSSLFEGSERTRVGLQKIGVREIRSNIGLKVVCLIKSHAKGVAAKFASDQVSEQQLPSRVLEEFADLSTGLLSNVALATIAAIRDTAHHVVGSFAGNLDGPYFHHRATIANPDEAEEYAVAIVLEGLKTAVRLRQVGTRFAGHAAIERRIRALAAENNELTLAFTRGPERPTEELSFSVDDVVRLVRDGVKTVYNTIELPDKPGRPHFERAFTSLFAGNLTATREAMNVFAALAGTGSNPETHDVRSGTYTPSLALGSIVRETNGKYLLCLQASCDSVRVKVDRPFIFVPLNEVTEGGQYVVPRWSAQGRVEYVALRVEEFGYAKARSVIFSPDPESEKVLASRIGRPKRLRFKSVNGRTYEWVADLKSFHAINVAQNTAHQMGRLGFDEFEPFREKNGR